MNDERKPDSMAADLTSMVASVTKKWKAEKKKTGRGDRLRSSQYARFNYRRVTIREVAFDVMEKACAKASSGGKFYANARQIFYAARPLILPRIEEAQLDSQYFTQTLLKDYMEYCEPSWKVVWDARGHFHEPHTDKEIGVGGVDVMGYIKSWRNGDGVAGIEIPDVKTQVETKGPHNRFRSVLFIEKEGFDEILEDAQIGKRYDLALMSTKGVPTKAACDLLCALEGHVTIYALHDFDVSGFKILKTLQRGTRMARGVSVVDIGLRYADIQGLESEPVDERGNVVRYLRGCGATGEEISFLAGGQRVELNAMMSEQFLEWLERKLKGNGVQKVLPEEEVLAQAYRRAYFGAEVAEFLVDKESELKEADVPKLTQKVRDALKEKPELSWDEAVWNLAENDFGGQRKKKRRVRR